MGIPKCKAVSKVTEETSPHRFLRPFPQHAPSAEACWGESDRPDKRLRRKAEELLEWPGPRLQLAPLRLPPSIRSTVSLSGDRAKAARG